MKKSIVCDKAGAVFISRDTDSYDMNVWPAVYGIKKCEGCVFFRPSKEYSDMDMVDIVISEEAIREVYYDCPEEEEAWLVTPRGKDWVWERVDEQLKLL